MSEMLRAAAVGSAFLLVLGAAELWRWHASPPPEWSRKFVHFTGGLLVLAFPWIFESRWTVAALVASFSLMIWGTRRAGLLQSVHGVSRASEGGLFYPLGVVLLFTVAYDRPAFYLAAALALIVSDTTAALLGSAYGRRTYTVENDRRSVEGSCAFFLTTFLSVHLPLLLMTGIDRDVSVLVAVQVALVVTLVEGVSLKGSDNVLVPMSALYLLVRLTPESAQVIAGHVAALVAILTLLGLVAWRSQLFKASGVMAASLFFYAVYALGGTEWMVAPALSLLALAGLRTHLGNLGPLPEADYQVVATFYAGTVGVLLVLANDLAPLMPGMPHWLGRPQAFRGPFTGAIIGHLAIVAATQLRPFGPRNRPPPSMRITLALLGAALLVVAPFGLWLAGSLTIVTLGTTSAIALLAVLLYWFARRWSGWPARAPWNMRLQTACVATATALILPIHLRLLMGG